MGTKKLVRSFLPPPRWRLPVIIALGILVGLGLLVLRVSRATSYLSDDPQACVNCHVMNPQFASWQKSSHFNKATCNDCHIPHTNIIRQYLFKANDGLQHSFVFTFKLEPQVIKIDASGINVVQENCIRCHKEQMNTTKLITVSGDEGMNDKAKLCWDCHKEVPHGKVRSLSSTPFAYRPALEDPIPKWIKNFMEEKNNNGN